jgi:Trypsin-like peptidase domain
MLFFKHCILQNMKILCFLLFLIPLSSYCQQIDITEQIYHSTIKVQVKEKKVISGKSISYTSSGTGFFFEFKIGDKIIPVIITNRHVVKNAEIGYLQFTFADSLNRPIYGKGETLEIDKLKDKCIYHPDSSIDLALIPMAPYYNIYQKNKIRLFFISFNESNIPDEKSIANLLSIEEVFMIGYPFGLKDNKNNLPIIRKGTTATPYFINYENTSRFLVDIPIYFGSSGSPVIIFRNGFFGGKESFTVGEKQVILLGINHATYLQNFEGEVVPKYTLNSLDSIKVKTMMPYNIAIVIKSQRILDFKPLLLELISKKK